MMSDIKTWQDRYPHTFNLKVASRLRGAMQAEIDDLRARVAELEANNTANMQTCKGIIKGLVSQVAELESKVEHWKKARQNALDAGDIMRAKLAALEGQQGKPTKTITPLEERQMFDDWCPYKGNPDPRTVWAAAIDAANGLLLGAQPERQPMTREEIDAAYVRHQNCAFALSFEGGVFAAEKHHNIGAKS